MTAPSIIDAQRREDLEAFEEVFATLPGVAPEHLEALRRSATATATRPHFPATSDPIGQAAYTAIALHGLAASVAKLHEKTGKAPKAKAKAAK